MTNEYDELIAAGKHGLSHDELWCVIDPGGEPMVETESKRFDQPVKLFCNALNCDWEDAKEIGYRLGKTIPVPNGEQGGAA